MYSPTSITVAFRLVHFFILFLIKVSVPQNTPSKFDLKYLEAFEHPYVKISVLCKICSKEQSLKYQASWKRHYLTHVDDKPYKCNYCQKSFVQSTQYKSHIKTHAKKGDIINIKVE